MSRVERGVVKRVGRHDPGAQLLLAPQPLEVTAPALGHDRGEHDLGVVAPGGGGLTCGSVERSSSMPSVCRDCGDSPAPATGTAARRR